MKLEDILGDKEADDELKGSRKHRQATEVTPEQHRQYVQDRLYEAFARWKPHGSLEEKYQSATVSVKELSVQPTCSDISEFCLNQKFGDWNSDGLGIFVTALINWIIKPDEVITLKSRRWILDDYLGVFLERGTVIIDGNVRYHVGHAMKGGKLIVKGYAIHGYGNDMIGGDLIVEGDVYGSGLCNMKGGHAVIHVISTKGDAYDHGYFTDGISPRQEGGLIEIISYIPAIVGIPGDRGIGFQQTGGELRVYGNVHCAVNSEQKGGKTYVKGNVIGGHVGVGYCKQGGETIIDGDLLERDVDGYKYSCSVGLNQEGGLIWIKGNVHGTVAFNSYPNAEIIIEKNVYDRDVYSTVGNNYTHGTKITIKGDVKGNVGEMVRAFECTIHGNVYGNVGGFFGWYNHESERTREGRIEVKRNVYGDAGRQMHSRCKIIVDGNVTGTVGQGMYGGEIHVRGKIGRIGGSIDGKVYQNGRDVTNIPLTFRILKGVFGVGPR